MRSIFGATGGVPKSRWPFAALSPTFSEMGKSSSSKKKKSAQPEPESASSTPQKAGGSPAKSKNSLSKEDAQQKVIDDLKKSLMLRNPKTPRGANKKGATSALPIPPPKTTNRQRTTTPLARPSCRLRRARRQGRNPDRFRNSETGPIRRGSCSRTKTRRRSSERGKQ